MPAIWGWKAKLALINAVGVAGLNVLGLVNENSAAAINFAITRNDTDPVNIGFFNLGSHNLQFSIVNISHYLKRCNSMVTKMNKETRTLNHSEYCRTL